MLYFIEDCWNVKSKEGNMVPMKKTFEENLKRLEDIVRQLQREGTTLQEGLDLMEEGVALVAQCNEQLTQGKGKLEILQKNGEATLSQIDDLEEDNDEL